MQGGIMIMHDYVVKILKSSCATINLLLHDHTSVLLFPQSPCQNLRGKKKKSCKWLKVVGI